MNEKQAQITTVFLIVSVGCLIAFVYVHEAVSVNPMLDLSTKLAWIGFLWFVTSLGYATILWIYFDEMIKAEFEE